MAEPKRAKAVVGYSIEMESHARVWPASVRRFRSRAATASRSSSTPDKPHRTNRTPSRHGWGCFYSPPLPLPLPHPLPTDTGKLRPSPAPPPSPNSTPLPLTNISRSNSG